jgi:hypothetical protein
MTLTHPRGHAVLHRLFGFRGRDEEALGDDARAFVGDVIREPVHAGFE